MIKPEQVGMSSARLARIRPAVERWVGRDKLAGSVTLLARRGEIVHLDAVGLMDRERDKPMRPDTIFRIFSMTKPVVCVGLMMLYEHGLFQLIDPVSKFIPAFNDLRVYAGRDDSGVKLTYPQRPVTIRDLLTHTAGLTYHFFEYGPVEEMYRQSKATAEQPLAEFIDGLLTLPLAFQPGTRWRYSVAHDVVARLIEIISGQPLDEYLQDHIFGPLGMVDTGYYVPPRKVERFAAEYGAENLMRADLTVTELYMRAMMGANQLIRDPENCLEITPHNAFRGGHGLVSTAPDYFRFAQMLLNGGELDGARLLGRKTIELMTTNHLPPELLPYEMAGLPSPGAGYGLGFGVLMDIGQAQVPGSPGTFSWGGAASTSFWVDPREELIGIQMAQFQPGGYHPVDPAFRVTAYQAIVD